MNKQDLVKELAQRTDLSQITVRTVLDAFLEEILVILEEGGQYSQTGFGSFKTEVSPERISYNPSVQSKMILPKKRKMKFRPSLKLKEQIND